MTNLDLDAGLLETLELMARTEGHADVQALLEDYVNSWTRDRLGSEPFQQ